MPVRLLCAGKSTLLSRLSSARPKIADYPFTTLVPNLGVVDGSIVGEYWDRSLVIADIPGLIEGASDGKGLGIQFLRHLERTSAIAYVLDAFDTYLTPDIAFEKLTTELRSFDADLAAKPALLVLNKIDLIPDPSDRDQLIADLEKLGHEVIVISAATGEGIKDLVHRAAELAAEAREAAENEEAEEPTLDLRPLPDFGSRTP